MYKEEVHMSIKKAQVSNKEFQQIHRFFLDHVPLTSKNFVTTKNMQQYYKQIDSTQRTFFNSNGHLMAAMHYKHLYRTKNIDEALDIVGAFMKSPFTKSERQDIKTNIKLIFSSRSSRVKELKSKGGGLETRDHPQSGAGKINVFLIFSCLYMLLQTTWYYVHIQYYSSELARIAKDVNTTVYDTNYMMKSVFRTDLREVYGELTTDRPDQTWIGKVVHSTAALFVEKSALESTQIKQDLDMFVMFYSVLNNKFGEFVVTPSTEFTSPFAATVMNKRNAAIEKDFVNELQEKRENFELQNSLQKSYFYDNRDYFSVAKQKDITHEMKRFEHTVQQLTDVLNDKTSNTPLSKNPVVKNLLESMDDIAVHLDSYKNKLEDSLQNLSDSKEITLVYEKKSQTGVNQENTQFRDLFYQYSGLNALATMNKIIDDQVQLMYNTYVTPLVQSFEDIKRSVNMIIGTIHIGVTNIRSVVKRAKELHNDDDELRKLIQGLPSQMKLTLGIFYRLYAIVPGLMRYLTSMVTILVGFLIKIARYIKEKRNKTLKSATKGRRITAKPPRNIFLSPSVQSKRKSPSKSKSNSNSNSNSRSKTPSRRSSRSKKP